jgi:hypothetical protein
MLLTYDCLLVNIVVSDIIFAVYHLPFIFNVAEMDSMSNYRPKTRYVVFCFVLDLDSNTQYVLHVGAVSSFHIEEEFVLVLDPVSDELWAQAGPYLAFLG